METETCPDDGLLLKLSSGVLPPEEEARAREHIDRCPDCSEVVARVTRTESNRAVHGHPRHLKPGEVIANKYRLSRPLGSGGMANVMAATHMALERPVAIKFLTDRDPQARARFEREARALVKVKSPYIVNVIDVDALPDGSPFMVMELLRGQDLGDYLEARLQLPVEEVLRYVLELCLGLEAAHAAGIIHRDLKPQNIFLSDENDGTRVRLIDFGLAKTTSTEELTRPREFLGTPYYMAPELIEDARGADPRTDVWGVGAVMYLMLTGENPFEGTTLPAICRKVLHEEPPRIEERRPELPRALGDIVHRCLSKAPSDRYPSIPALAEAIRAIGPPKTRPLWPYLLVGIVLAVGLAFFLRGKNVPAPIASSSASASALAPPSVLPLSLPLPSASTAPVPPTETSSAAPPSVPSVPPEEPPPVIPRPRRVVAPAAPPAPAPRPTSSTKPRLYDRY